MRNERGPAAPSIGREGTFSGAIAPGEAGGRASTGKSKDKS